MAAYHGCEKKTVSRQRDAPFQNRGRKKIQDRAKRASDRFPFDRNRVRRDPIDGRVKSEFISYKVANKLLL